MATALTIPVSPPAANADPLWEEVGWLPCRLSVEIPVARFTLGDLLSLKVNSLVDARTQSDTNVPVSVNGACIGFGKFNMAGDQVAVRLSELA
jgi:flagellar motor switch/type III secretory pathway protein FliN